MSGDLDIIGTKALLRSLAPRCNGRPPIREAKVLLHLHLARGKWVNIDELISYVYADCDDGGPLHDRGTVYVVIHNLRRRGVAIESRYGWGYRLPQSAA